MGCWVWVGGVGGVWGGGGGGGWGGGALLGVLGGGWVGGVVRPGIGGAANVYDRRHPKLGHPPFDWRRVRPRPRPWAAESETLLAAESQTLLAAGRRGWAGPRR